MRRALKSRANTALTHSPRLSFSCACAAVSAEVSRSEPCRTSLRHSCCEPKSASVRDLRLASRDLSRCAARHFAFAQSISATKRVRTCRACVLVFLTVIARREHSQINCENYTYIQTYCLCFCYCFVLFVYCVFCVYFGGVFRPFCRALARNVQFVISSLFTFLSLSLTPLTVGSSLSLALALTRRFVLGAGCASLPTRTCFPTAAKRSSSNNNTHNSLARKIPKRFLLSRCDSLSAPGKFNLCKKSKIVS